MIKKGEKEANQENPVPHSLCADCGVIKKDPKRSHCQGDQPCHCMMNIQKIGIYLVVWRRSDRKIAGSLSLHAPGKPGKSVDDLVGRQDGLNLTGLVKPKEKVDPGHQTLEIILNGLCLVNGSKKRET